MLETYTGPDGELWCDNCNKNLDEECVCACSECGDHVTECGCEEGPTYPAVSDY